MAHKRHEIKAIKQTDSALRLKARRAHSLRARWKRRLIASTGALSLLAVFSGAAHAFNAKPRTPLLQGTERSVAVAAFFTFKKAGENLERPASTSVLEEARRHIGITETGGDNRGPMIRIFLRADQSKALPKGKAAPEGSSWCAGFISYVFNNAAPGTVDYTVLAKDVMQQSIDKNAFYPLNSTYTPQPGDLIFFERGNDGDWRGHVGIVESVDDDGTLHTIEGNKYHPDFEGVDNHRYDRNRPDSVRRVTYAPDNFKKARILGFGDTEKMAPPTITVQPAPPAPEV